MISFTFLIRCLIHLKGTLLGICAIFCHDTQMSKSKLDLAWHGSVGGLVFCLKFEVFGWFVSGMVEFFFKYIRQRVLICIPFLSCEHPVARSWKTKSSARSCSPKLKSQMMTWDGPG